MQRPVDLRTIYQTTQTTKVVEWFFDLLIMIIFLVKAAQFILSLSIIVVIHELGHFLGAKFCKTRVEKFYLFFNPWFSLFKKKINGTEYGVGWIPLGGFVKIAGMVDESMDKEKLKEEPKPWEYRSKKHWQKLIMITGGVIFNFFLAWIIYSLMLFAWGENYVDAQAIPYGIAVDSTGRSIGLEDGDLIIALDEKPAVRFNKITSDIITQEVQSITIKRKDKELILKVPENFAANVISERNLNFIAVRLQNATIDSVLPMSLASELNLAKGDLIIQANGQSVLYSHELNRFLKTHRNQNVSFLIKRNDNIFQVQGRIPEDGILGIQYHAVAAQDEIMKQKSYSFWGAIPAGFVKSINVLTSYWSQLKILFSGQVNVNENLGGLISIGKLFPQEWNWKKFWGWTAFLSLMIGLVNILPIPALDGGHMMIILLEWVSGKQFSQRTLEVIQTIGFMLLVTLMVYALGLDILRLFR